MTLRNPILMSLIAALAIVFVPTGRAATADQTLSLDPGWNSIWLTVDPQTQGDDGVVDNKLVEEVFTSNAITVVATPYKKVGIAEAQALTSVARNLDGESWRIWRRNGGAFGLSTLERVRGHAAYLVYVDPNLANTAIRLTVTGAASFQAPRWVPNQFNLIGFGIEGTPSFAEVFGSSNGKLPVNRIFKIDPSGNWSAAAPTATVLSGEAGGVFGGGAVEFMGPVSAKFQGLRRLDFGAGTRLEVIGSPANQINVSLEELVLSNVTSSDQTAGLRQVSTAETPDTADLRVYEVEPKPSEIGYNIVQEIANPNLTLAASGTEVMTLAASRNWSAGNPEREELFQLVLGNVWYWLPIAATNSDLSLSGDSSTGSEGGFTGLWHGTIALDKVTSFETGDLEAAPVTMPLKILIHIDGTGQARLLQHATLMQTRTADGSSGEPVVVIRPELLSQFEWVERRGFRLVGKRLETIDFDMPRSFDPSSYDTENPAVQSFFNGILAVTGMGNFSEITPAILAAYVLDQKSRPPGLKESYESSWPLDGGIGPGQSLTTGSNPLTLDPFHRSNPFRHAFHRDHVTGFLITREITIVPSGFQQSGRIVGQYQEKVSGLANADIESSGTIELVRVSEAAELR